MYINMRHQVHDIYVFVERERKRERPFPLYVYEYEFVGCIYSRGGASLSSCIDIVYIHVTSWDVYIHIYIYTSSWDVYIHVYISVSSWMYIFDVMRP